MSRAQLALNVADIDVAVEFYSNLFSVQPAKRRPGYANFAIAEPPLALVLIESREQAAGTLNHLGVEVDTSAEVAAAQARLSGQGLAIEVEQQTACCYALQDKVWAHGPDGEQWEIYTVLADADAPVGKLCSSGPNETACCAPRTEPAGLSTEAGRCC